MKILVVDDEKLLVKGIKFNLENDGYEVVTGCDGMEAVELAASETPDLIVLDLMMPQVNGWDVIKHVRASYDKSEMAIIVVSLLNNKDNIDDCYEMGVNDYICKPIIKAQLVSSVETHKEKIVEPTPKASPTMVALHNKNNDDKAIFGM